MKDDHDTIWSGDQSIDLVRCDTRDLVDPRMDWLSD